MFSIDFAIFALIYVSLGMSGVWALWFYYDMRERKTYELERTKYVFHCIKCGHLYTSAQHSDAVCCPKCSFENPRLKF